VNTCAVTANASRKNRQAIRKVASSGKTSVFVVGCGASEDRQRLAQIPGVTAVFGHDEDVSHEIHSTLAAWVGANSKRRKRAEELHTGKKSRLDAAGNDLWIKADVSERNSAPTSSINSTSNNITQLSIVNATGDLTEKIESFDGHQRAFLKVQDGCDAFCSYCIIPRLRSTLKSKPVEVAVAEAQGLVRSGHKEIILTGIFLGAFGRGTALRSRWGDGPSPLVALVDALVGVEGLARLRLSSLEPGDVDDSLLDVLARHDSCVPHLHLPLQSGSSETLRKMNRQYSRDAFIEMIDRVRDRLDRPSISTDIIVGFPGETEDDFQASLDIARYAQFCKIHAFPFSPRDKTAAARWQHDFVPPPIVRERMQRLAEVERECSLAYRRRFIGQVERVIVEQSGDDELSSGRSHVMHHGRADRYFEIHFEARSTGLQPVGTARGGGGDEESDTGRTGYAGDRTGLASGNTTLAGAMTESDVRPGDLVRVRVDRVTPARTHGTLIRPYSDTYPLYVLSDSAV
jgi:threonylcarbamoyladenosine tRNA methylthiotransferase MtaB